MKRLIGFLSVVLALLFSPLVSLASTHAQNEKSFIEKVEKVESVVIVVDLKVDKQFNNTNFKPYLITKIDNTNFKPYSISLNYNQHWLKC